MKLKTSESQYSYIPLINKDSALMVLDLGKTKISVNVHSFNTGCKIFLIHEDWVKT